MLAAQRDIHGGFRMNVDAQVGERQLVKVLEDVRPQDSRLLLIRRISCVDAKGPGSGGQFHVRRQQSQRNRTNG